jgi:hypothetical protein
MAISKTLTLTDNFGVDVTLADTYIQILKVDYTKTDNKFIGNLTYYIKNKERTQILFVDTKQFNLTLDGVNFVQQAYEHLKTLPEFADATDC